jgi:hypothetical protein
MPIAKAGNRDARDVQTAATEDLPPIEMCINLFDFEAVSSKLALTQLRAGTRRQRGECAARADGRRLARGK